jgi:hypothetical protein
MGSKIYEGGKSRYRLILQSTHKVKRLYLLKGMPYCHNASIVLKLVHYDSVSDFSTGHCVLHTHTHYCRLEDADSTLFLRKSRGTASTAYGTYVNE